MRTGRGQSQVEFFKLLTLTFDRWLRASEAGEYKELYNLVLLEQFKMTLAEAVKAHVSDLGIKEGARAAEVADNYALSHKGIGYRPSIMGERKRPADPSGKGGVRGSYRGPQEERGRASFAISQVTSGKTATGGESGRKQFLPPPQQQRAAVSCRSMAREAWQEKQHANMRLGRLTRGCLRVSSQKEKWPV